MVNIEKNNKTSGTSKTRKIEIYRKNSIEPGFQSESDNICEPKLIEKEDKLLFIKIGLIASFLIFFLIVVISSSLFSNPFHSTPKINKEKDSTITDIVVSEQSTPIKEETMFFYKDGKVKLFNVIIATGISFSIIRAIKSLW